jgi:Fic family protein
MFGTVFGQGMKSARIADQIDAQVTSGKSLVQNAKITAQQFDLVENTLQQVASLIASSGDTMAAMQFENLQQQINNIQAQLVNSLNQIETVFVNIDGLTDKIQN